MRVCILQENYFFKVISGIVFGFLEIKCILFDKIRYG